MVEAPGAGRGPQRIRAIRPFRPDDLTAMSALDAAGTGEDRCHLFRAFADAGNDPRASSATDGALGGFVVRAPWGGGATIAPDPEDALAILHARRRRPGSGAAGPGRRARVATRRASSVCAARGWTEAWRAPRLVRGDPLGLAAGRDLGPVQPRRRLNGDRERT